jgi:hypothetical protein
MKIGQTTHLAERKKANKHANHDLVCLIYLDGAPLPVCNTVAEALRTQLESLISWIIDPGPMASREEKIVEYTPVSKVSVPPTTYFLLASTK